MSYFMLIFSLWILSVNCRIKFDYSRKGVIGHDLSITNELRESLSVGWYGDIKYVSNEETTLGSSGSSKAHKRDGGTTDPGDAKPGTSGADAKPGQPLFSFILNHLSRILLFISATLCSY